jgi:hypothetical protein
MRPRHGGAAAFAGSARCGELGSSVAQVAGSEVGSEIGLTGGGAWPFEVSDRGAGLLATGSLSGFWPSFAGEEGTPLRAGSYFLDALSFYDKTARPPQDAAFWPWGCIAPRPSPQPPRALLGPRPTSKPSGRAHLPAVPKLRSLTWAGTCTAR